jgi:HK97 family phage major capsid protein
MSIQALRERLAASNKAANHLLAEKGSQTWTKEDQLAFDGHVDEAAQIKSQIAAHEQMIAAGRENDVADAARQAISAAARRGGNVETMSERDLVALYMRHGANVNAEQALAIRNAMSTTTTTEGGFTVPSEVAKMVIDALKTFGGMRNVATILQTDSGVAINYPGSDGTAEVGVIVGENAAATTGDITFSQVPLVVYKYSSNKIALPRELIQDSAIDVVAFVINRLAQRLGRITNTHYTVGTGTAQPFGIVARASSGKVGLAGQTLTVIYDDLVDLFYSVNRAYRANGCGWMMADSSLKVVRKIKDTAGRPIFTPGYEYGITQDVPDLLMGKPIDINDDVATMAANAKSIIFGDLKQYVIRDVTGTDIRRFDDSAFALNGQVGFCGWQRTGGNLLDTAAVKYYANSAT